MGYGGTETEMERLIKDAEGLDKSFKASRDSNGELTMSYADIVDAIHIVQDEMGITGTTAAEASGTISGSIDSMKAAFSNFVTGLADENADIEQLTEDLVKTVGTVLSNLAPVVGRVLKTIGSLALEGIKNIGRNIWQSITDTFNSIVDSALQWGKDLIDNFVNGIKQKWEDLKNGVKDAAQTVKDFLGFSEPDKGPLSNFHTYAPDMMELFAKGIKDNEKVVTGQIEKSFDFGDQMYTASVDGKRSQSAARSNTDALLEQILVKLSGMGIYLDGQSLVGYVDNQLGSMATSNSRLALA